MISVGSSKSRQERLLSRTGAAHVAHGLFTITQRAKERLNGRNKGELDLSDPWASCEVRCGETERQSSVRRCARPAACQGVHLKLMAMGEAPDIKIPFMVGVIIQLLTLAHPSPSSSHALEVIDRPALGLFFFHQIKSEHKMISLSRASVPRMILSKAHFNFWTSSYLNTHSRLAAAATASRSTAPLSSRPMSLTNGDLSAARAAVSEQVKFDILTQTQDAVCF